MNVYERIVELLKEEPLLKDFKYVKANFMGPGLLGSKSEKFNLTPGQKIEVVKYNMNFKYK